MEYSHMRKSLYLVSRWNWVYCQSEDVGTGSGAKVNNCVGWIYVRR